MPEPPLLGSTPRTPSAKVRVAELAERQWGVVSRRQLEEVGVSKAAFVRWMETGRLHRVHPGVYAVGHPGLGMEGKLAAALFYAGKGAALCNLTAASWMAVWRGMPEQIHVCVRGRKRSLDTVQVHQEKKFKRVWHNGLPVTQPAQTLLDIADEVGFRELRRAVSEAEYLKLVTLEEVEAVLGRGKPGSTKLRAALESHRPQLAKTKSVLEEKFVLLCEDHSLTPPDVNVGVEGFEVDAVWRDRKVVVELDGLAAHGTAARIERDRRRDLALRAAGYTVIRYTWKQITETPELVVADLRRHITRPAGSRRPR